MVDVRFELTTNVVREIRTHDQRMVDVRFELATNDPWSVDDAIL